MFCIHHKGPVYHNINTLAWLIVVSCIVSSCVSGLFNIAQSAINILLFPIVCLNLVVMKDAFAQD